MTRGCYLLSGNSPRNISMSRSNPAALRGVPLPPAIHLETITENGCMDQQYTETVGPYLPSPEPQSESVTPTPTYQLSHHSVWGVSEETTLTEAQSGRYSAWSTEEWEFDRAATEKVGQMFRHINGALYEGCGSGFTQTDRECHEWSNTFPHFQVRGVHLLDSLEDGTEVVAPVEREGSSHTPAENIDGSTDTSKDGLEVVGRHLDVISLSDTPEDDALKEEIIEMQGVLEEYLAFDNSAENGGRGRRRKLQGFPSAPCQLPPVTAESSVRHAVWSQVLDQLWSEVVTILAPLVLAARDRALKEHSSRYSRQTSLSTSHSTSPHESSRLLPGLNQPPPTTAGHQHTSQYYPGKPPGSSFGVPALPQLPQQPALFGVMQIKSVSLRQRMPAIMGHNEREEELMGRLSIQPLSQQMGAESASLTQSRLARHNHLLQQRSSELPLLPSAAPSTPPGAGGGGYRQFSSRVAASRRPQQLRPIDNPRTPALERIKEARVRGYKLSTNTSSTIMMMMSPPPTAGGGVAPGGVVSSGHVRHTQLPPLEIGSSVGPTALPTERSPPVIRGKSTFSQRHSSSAAVTAELQELRRLQLSGRPSDLRPNTSSSYYRAESGKPLTGKKLPSDPSSRGGGGMKIVGYATGVSHSNSSTGSAGVDQSGSGKLSGGLYGVGSIAENEEEEEEENLQLNITGYSSGFLKSKPRNLLGDNRGKHRGHGR